MYNLFRKGLSGAHFTVEKSFDFINKLNNLNLPYDHTLGARDDFCLSDLLPHDVTIEF